MNNITTASSRLRRTFAYPDDSPNPRSNDSSDDEDAPALDEQEQDDLIATLAQQNAARNAQFRLFLLCLPAVSTLPYLTALVFPSDASGRLIALLGLTSLAATAWTLWSLPPGVSGIRILDAWVGGSGSSNDSKHGAGGRRGGQDINNSPFWAQEQTHSPFEKYLPYLNLGLCGVLVLTGFISKSPTSQGHWGHVGLSNLPAIVYAVVLVAKAVMGGVDPEKELSALRYEYKGA
ncbi:uncharacterized protein F4822DRAFT_404169 [Hypoxylon trugodes]|uniref:uncharacterized protein n=1 Tax=Hypoxylon trugodes TaxID=326681 RepID=UPI0021968C7E|nr:uncharacterized protein F4822DRAFT_404169 [Hypoxylon trugodes]KAI1388853.1 hypothetical protein F4822DRAFT_404169 [Hypoxylon trugodes]